MAPGPRAIGSLEFEANIEISPSGDFEDVHRCGLLAVKARVLQNGLFEYQKRGDRNKQL